MHWVGDDELLDRYLREELDHREREKLDGHLAVCESCRRRVSAERDMVRGVQAFARKQLKSDLQAMLAARRSGRTTMYRWVGLAATLVLAIAVWYIPGDEPDMPHQEELVPGASAEAKPEAEAESADADEVVSEAAPSEMSRPVEVSSPRREEEARARDAAAGAGLQAIHEEAAADRSEDILGESGGRRARTVWTIATRLKRELDHELPAPAAAAAQAMEADGRRKALLREDRYIQGWRSTVIRQLPFFEADREMQTIVAGSDESVPVRLQQVGDSLLVTLYPPGTLDDTELANATVSQIGVDSLQVRVGKRDFLISLKDLGLTPPVR